MDHVGYWSVAHNVQNSKAKIWARETLCAWDARKRFSTNCFFVLYSDKCQRQAGRERSASTVCHISACQKWQRCHRTINVVAWLAGARTRFLPLPLSRRLAVLSEKQSKPKSMSMWGTQGLQARNRRRILQWEKSKFLKYPF